MLTRLFSMIITLVQRDSTKAEIVIALCFFISLVCSVFMLPRIMIISKRKRLYDDPNARKCHSAAISRLGGLVFIPSVLIAFSLSTAFLFIIDIPFDSDFLGKTLLELLFLLGGSLFLYLVGVKDDLIGVRYRKKFIAQFFVATLFPLAGLYINNLYGLFGLYDISALIGVPFTIVLVVFITNAINLIDGIDGLAGGKALVAFITFGVLYILKEQWFYSILAFAFVGCLLPFLYYNVFGSASRGSKLFMGDSGSLSLGYMLSFFAIKYVMYIPGEAMDGQCLVIPFSLLFVPVFDALRVMVVRAFQNHPLFLADRSHIHHKCLDAGFTHLQATSLLIGYTVIMLFVNLGLFRIFNLNILVILNMLVAILINYFLGIRIRSLRKIHDFDFGNVSFPEIKK
nr:MraY family glycosyltransferase [Parabacteroides goldsteinii]